jgi:penicillin-binding protein 1A
MRIGPGQQGPVILEAFKPGTAPPDSYSVIGVSGDPAGGGGPQPEIREGRGLY